MTRAGHRAGAAGDLLAGRYRLLRQVGSGAMGVVWQAEDERLHRTVAVKQLVLPPGHDAAGLDQARQRALREGRIAARLHHPHAVAVYDVAIDDGLPLVVMEYLPARSLAEALAAEGRLEPVHVARIGAQAASALAAAHAAGIVHRDVKPGNLLLTDDTIKLTDFGISRAHGDVTVTQTGLFAGTPAFLAPEVAGGAESAASSDVFSLGATLYAAVEGSPPFGENAENPLALLRAVAEGSVPPPEHAGPLKPVLAAMLQPDPRRRITAAQTAEALHAVAVGAPLPANVAATAWPTTAPAARGPSGTLLAPLPAGLADRPRRRLLPVVAAAIALLVGALLVGLLVSGQEKSPTSTPTFSATDKERAVANYYRLLPERAEEAWTRLSRGLRADGKQQFLTRWQGVSDVTFISPPRSTGTDSVHIGISLALADGSTVTEFHQHQVKAQGTRLVIASDTLLHRETAAPPPPDDKQEKPGKDDEREDKSGKGEGGDDRKGEEDKTGEEDKSGHDN